MVVTGISQNADTSAIVAALKAASLSLEPLSVFTSGDGLPDQADSGIRFVYTGSDSARTILGASSEILSFGGAETPGLGPSTSREYFAPESMTMQLSELGIPDSEVENYSDALEAERCVIAYTVVPATVAAVEQIFRDAGLAPVRTF